MNKLLRMFPLVALIAIASSWVTRKWLDDSESEPGARARRRRRDRRPARRAAEMPKGDAPDLALPASEPTDDTSPEGVLDADRAQTVTEQADKTAQPEPQPIAAELEADRTDFEIVTTDRPSPHDTAQPSESAEAPEPPSMSQAEDDRASDSTYGSIPAVSAEAEQEAGARRPDLDEQPPDEAESFALEDSDLWGSEQEQALRDRVPPETRMQGLWSAAEAEVSQAEEGAREQQAPDDRVGGERHPWEELSELRDGDQDEEVTAGRDSFVTAPEPAADPADWQPPTDPVGIRGENAESTDSITNEPSIDADPAPDTDDEDDPAATETERSEQEDEEELDQDSASYWRTLTDRGGSTARDPESSFELRRTWKPSKLIQWDPSRSRTAPGEDSPVPAPEPEPIEQSVNIAPDQLAPADPAAFVEAPEPAIEEPAPAGSPDAVTEGPEDAPDGPEYQEPTAATSESPPPVDTEPQLDLVETEFELHAVPADEEDGASLTVEAPADPSAPTDPFATADPFAPADLLAPADPFDSPVAESTPVESDADPFALDESWAPEPGLPDTELTAIEDADHPSSTPAESPVETLDEELDDQGRWAGDWGPAESTDPRPSDGEGIWGDPSGSGSESVTDVPAETEDPQVREEPAAEPTDSEITAISSAFGDLAAEAAALGEEERWLEEAGEDAAPAPAPLGGLWKEADAEIENDVLVEADEPIATEMTAETDTPEEAPAQPDASAEDDAELDETSAESFIDEGNSFYELDAFELAEHRYSRAIAAAPELVDAYYNRANARVRLGDLDGALSDFNRAIELSPDDPDALNNRGMLYLSAADADRALKDFERGAELRDDDATILVNLGVALTEVKRFADALRTFERAAVLDPSDAAARYGAARAAARLSEHDRALVHAREALSLDPTFREEMATDPMLEALHSIEAFEELLRGS